MREGKWISAAILRRVQPPFCLETSRHCVLHAIIELKQAAFLSHRRQPEVFVAFQLTSDVSGLRGQQSASEGFSCMCWFQKCEGKLAQLLVRFFFNFYTLTIYLYSYYIFILGKITLQNWTTDMTFVYVQRPAKDNEVHNQV